MAGLINMLNLNEIKFIMEVGDGSNTVTKVLKRLNWGKTNPLGTKLKNDLIEYGIIEYIPSTDKMKREKPFNLTIVGKDIFNELSVLEEIQKNGCNYGKIESRRKGKNKIIKQME